MSPMQKTPALSQPLSPPKRQPLGDFFSKFASKTIGVTCRSLRVLGYGLAALAAIAVFSTFSYSQPNGEKTSLKAVQPLIRATSFRQVAVSASASEKPPLSAEQWGAYNKAYVEGKVPAYINGQLEEYIRIYFPASNFQTKGADSAEPVSSKADYVAFTTITVSSGLPASKNPANVLNFTAKHTCVLSFSAQAPAGFGFLLPNAGTVSSFELDGSNFVVPDKSNPSATERHLCISGAGAREIPVLGTGFFFKLSSPTGDWRCGGHAAGSGVYLDLVCKNPGGQEELYMRFVCHYERKKSTFMFKYEDVRYGPAYLRLVARGKIPQATETCGTAQTNEAVQFTIPIPLNISEPASQ